MKNLFLYLVWGDLFAYGMSSFYNNLRLYQMHMNMLVGKTVPSTIYDTLFYYKSELGGKNIAHWRGDKVDEINKNKKEDDDISDVVLEIHKHPKAYYTLLGYGTNRSQCEPKIGDEYWIHTGGYAGVLIN